jgi:hypothetical protein
MMKKVILTQEEIDSYMKIGLWPEGHYLPDGRYEHTVGFFGASQEAYEALLGTKKAAGEE